jgi:hypothetical protein
MFSSTVKSTRLNLFLATEQTERTPETIGESTVLLAYTPRR